MLQGALFGMVAGHRNVPLAFVLAGNDAGPCSQPGMSPDRVISMALVGPDAQNQGVRLAILAENTLRCYRQHQAGEPPSRYFVQFFQCPMNIIKQCVAGW